MRLRGIVQRLKPQFGQNHFELFGLAPAFAIERADLERAYLGLQAIIHPDRFAHAGDAERRASMQWTTRVNEAYRTLRNPVQRAQYLLELNGVDVAFESDTSMPKEFLMEQLELREKLEHARDVESLGLIQKNLNEERKNIEKQISEQLDARHDYQGARILVRKLMFLDRLGEEVDAAYERIEMRAPGS